jgi:hypothetical protein
MPELPRLDDLVRLADLRRDDADRVLERDARDRRGQEQAHEVERLLLLARFSWNQRAPLTARCVQGGCAIIRSHRGVVPMISSTSPRW